MPTISVYLKNKTYWKLSSEASKYDMTIGKLVGEICDNYAKFLDKKEVAHGTKEIQNSSRIVSD